jgi:hypothetical protein
MKGKRTLFWQSLVYAPCVGSRVYAHPSCRSVFYMGQPSRISDIWFFFCFTSSSVGICMALPVLFFGSMLLCFQFCFKKINFFKFWNSFSSNKFKFEQIWIWTDFELNIFQMCTHFQIWKKFLVMNKFQIWTFSDLNNFQIWTILNSNNFKFEQFQNCIIFYLNIFESEQF